jgi:hypothetical protein
MSLHHSTFEYLQPTENQLAQIADIRSHFADFAEYLDSMLPEGPDKTYPSRKFASRRSKV